MRESPRHAIPPTPDQAIAAMNHGYALGQEDDNTSLQSAINAYSQAIQILTTAKLSPTNANSLGAALMNRGQLQHRLYGIHSSHLASSDFNQAAKILRQNLEPSTPWARRNLIGTLTNHANLLLDLEQFPQAKAKAEEALAINKGADLTDPTDCELTLLAARSYCDALGQLLPSLPLPEQNSLANLANEQINTGLQLIRSLRPLVTIEPFAGLSIRLFHFGCLLNSTHQPHFLNTLITSHLENLRDDSVRAYFSNTARQTIPIAVNALRHQLLQPGTSLEEQDQLTLTSRTLAALYTKLSSL